MKKKKCVYIAVLKKKKKKDGLNESCRFIGSTIISRLLHPHCTTTTLISPTNRRSIRTFKKKKLLINF